MLLCERKPSLLVWGEGSSLVILDKTHGTKKQITEALWLGVQPEGIFSKTWITFSHTTRI